MASSLLLKAILLLVSTTLTQGDAIISRKFFRFAPPPTVRKDPGQTVELRWMLETVNFTLLSLKCGLLRPEQTIATTLAEKTDKDIALRPIPRLLLPELLRDRISVSYPTSLIISNLRREDTNFYGCIATVYSKNDYRTMTLRSQTQLLVGVTDATGGTGARSGSGSNNAIIIGVVVVIIIAIIAVVVGVYVARKRKRAGKMGFGSEDSNKNLRNEKRSNSDTNGRSPGAIQRLSKSDILYTPVEVTSTPMDAISRHNSSKLYAVSELDENDRGRLTSSSSTGTKKAKDEWC